MMIEITEVFLRDGLQDVDVVVPTSAKLDLASDIVEAGLPWLELGSFVNPARVPQMADAPDIAEQATGQVAERGQWLALNAKGVQRAVAAGARTIQVVASASRRHSTANAGADPDVMLDALAAQVSGLGGIRVVAGVSTAFTCPFEGEVDQGFLGHLVSRFADMGISQIGLADTLGNATTDQVLAGVATSRAAAPAVDLSLHLHDAYGQALTTVTAALDAGIRRFDASLAGYGGCPFAPGAHGNLATEALVDHLHARGHDTGVDADAVHGLAARARHLVATSPGLSAQHA